MRGFASAARAIAISWRWPRLGGQRDVFQHDRHLRDRETRRRGDKEIRIGIVSLSPCLLVSLTLVAERDVIEDHAPGDRRHLAGAGLVEHVGLDVEQAEDAL